MNITVDKLMKAYRAIGREPFGYDPKKPYNLNFIGVRSNDNTPDVFNDCLAVMWQDAFGWNLMAHEATTDPGLYYLQNPINVNGTFIMAPGYHKGLWKLGTHRGYEAFQQIRIAYGWRDANRDNEFDMAAGKVIPVSNAGINMHRAKDEGESTVVGKWSAGCQVRRRDDDHEMVVELAKRALNYWGNSFSYVLFTENQLG